MIKKIINDLSKQILIIFLYFFIILILSSFINTKNFYLFNLLNILVELILIIVFLFLFRKQIVPDFYDFKKNGKQYLQKGLSYYIIGLFVMIISINIITFYFKSPINEELNQNYIVLYPYYAIFSILVTAPIVEELMTRAILKDTFKNANIYFFLSSFIFGFLHIFNSLLMGNYYELLYIVPYGALGFSLAKMYHETNNIWTNITYHFLHNLICLIISLGGI